MEDKNRPVVQPLLTDYYQISMAYAYWKVNKISDRAVFDLYFRTSPFSGEFTIFAGLSDCIQFLKDFRFTQEDIDFIGRALWTGIDTGFLDYLKDVTTNDVSLWAIPEGSVVFPRVPLIRIEGPLIICQLLETTLLNLVNYASLVTTNAARFRLAAGPDIQLLEFGLRRAQGPDGALSASRYSYIGGFDGTSNMLAGKLYNIPVKGTHAHAYVSSFNATTDITNPMITIKDGTSQMNLVQSALLWRKKLSTILGFLDDQVHEGELTGFVAYALAFPSSCLCLVDTYNVLKSGIPNFCAVALALHECGYRAVGVRIDSGDLAYLSVVVRDNFSIVAKSLDLPWFKNLMIVASNDINEDTIHSLNQQNVPNIRGGIGHEINCYGIGTHLVTCQKQPALGCVYKLVEINGRPTIKLSEDINKMTIPGSKEAFRLYGKDGLALVDFMQRPGEQHPEANQRILCRHPYQASKRAYVCPAKVDPLYQLYWKDGQIHTPIPTLEKVRQHTAESLATLRQDHKRALNPTPYKVSVSDDLYQFTHNLWMQSAPIEELS